MNKKILNKILSELMKESPDISYVKGILETLIESLPNEGLAGVASSAPYVGPTAKSTEAAYDPAVQMLESKALASAKSIQDIMQESVVTEN